MSECVFCRIVSGEIPAPFVHCDDEFVAFPDINPKAPTHLLVVPRVHVHSLNDAPDQAGGFGDRLLRFITETARRANVAESGFRVVINTGPDAGQEVPHLHVHILGGRDLGDIT